MNAIRLTGSDCLVEGNMITATTTVAGSKGIRLEGGTGGHMMQGNVITGMATGIGVNNCGTTLLNNNRTVGTTANSVNLYKAAAATTRVLTHVSTLSSGTNITDTAPATVTGPLVTM